ncbi:hypothetical protein AMECASPLE_039069 [Ameca splendens]|uniref:Uncharacterized protein n=1 Tax=Ameca splendens TaxID=208324 RepID=A0ABV0YVG5_9TELE
MRLIKQLRKGLKDVMVWPLLTSKPDVVPILFPKMAQKQFTPQVFSLFLSKCVKHLVAIAMFSDEEFDLVTKCRIRGFLRTSIKTGAKLWFVEKPPQRGFLRVRLFTVS